MTAAIFLHAIVPMMVFAGFVALTLLVRRGDTPRSSAPLRVLIFYVVVVSMSAGIGSRDLWPFAAWRYVPYVLGDNGSFLSVVSVDERGHEHALDPHAYEPLELAELLGYLDYHIERTQSAQRRELLRFMLQRAQAGLEQAAANRPVGTFARFLGPLAAPTFQVEANPWADRGNLPRELKDLRVYRVYWRVSGTVAQVENRILVADTRS